jgi:hypothetical protein
MIRVHFTGADFARTRVSQNPAPLVELKLSLMMLRRRDNDVFFGRWRRRLRTSLPASTQPLWDLVSGYRGPAFIDPVSVTVPEGLAAVHSTPAARIRDDIDRIYAHRSSAPPSWLHRLLGGDPGARDTLRRALEDAYQATLARTWPAVRDLHRTEFAQYALTAASAGVSRALTTLVPGSQLSPAGVWQLSAPYERDLHLNGRGLILVPTFHWTGMPLAADLPGQPVLLAYPAGPGLPVQPPGQHQDPLPAVLGPTRSHVLRLLADENTTTGVARLAGISPASASAHVTALRAAGLITTARDGTAARHRRTSLGTLLAG